MINITDKKRCCGCNACGDICAHQAITFETDPEGFWYPVVDRSRCTDCGLCEQVCPMLHVDALKKNDYEQPECFAAIHKNLEVRFDSTSGGLFSALADQMYAEGGQVGGAVYNPDFSVRQFISGKKEDLPRLRSSKYLQSDATGFYKQVRSLLKKGEKVLACGLPCQIAALNAFLGKPYDNLLTVDLICRYINSPLAYRKYLDSLEAEYGAKVTYIKAKNKELGWRKLTHKVVFANGKTYYGTFSVDRFMKASMKLNCLSRPACYTCPFKGFPRIADITLGDYWTDRKKSRLDDDTGTSVVLVNSEKGRACFGKIAKKIKMEPVSLDAVLAGNEALLRPLRESRVDRAAFFDRIGREDFGRVVDSLVAPEPMTLGKRVKQVLRVGRTVVKLTRLRPRPLWQFFRLNFFHPAVQSDFWKGFLIYPTPCCLFEIHRRARVELAGKLTFGESVFKNSRLETRIRMQAGALMQIGGDYGFGYGSDIEIFKGAVLISKGGPGTNMGTTIICQHKIVIGGEVAIGRDVTLRDNNGGHLISVNGYRDALPVVIGEHVWLCSGVTVMSGVRIGDGTIVSAGTLVNASFPPNVVVGGSPAHVTQTNVYWKM